MLFSKESEKVMVLVLAMGLREFIEEEEKLSMVVGLSMSLELLVRLARELIVSRCWSVLLKSDV